MTAYLLTIDNGTSSTKTALWDADGRLVAEAEQATPIRRPQPVWAEIDAEVWWQAAVNTTRAVLARSAIDARQVRGIGVDGVSWTLLAVDAQGRPLHPALLWLDRRAAAEAEWFRQQPQAKQWVALSANPLDPAYVTPKLLWMRRNHPQVFEQTYCFLSSSGFLVQRLTGEFTCDYTQAYGYHFFDIRRAAWDTSAAEALGAPLVKMPRLLPSTAQAGTLTPAAAEQLGLPAGITVIAGCLDAAAGALGAGVTRLGQTNEQGGQAGGMAISVDKVIVAPRLIFSHHVLPGQYLLQGGTVGGGSLGWLRQVLASVRPEAAPPSYESLDALAAEAPAGAHGLLFLPYLAGERTPLWSSTARGVFFGLSYSTTQADLLRAVLEGCVLAVYHNIQVAAEHGAQVEACFGSGGATRSPVWCQIKADVYGKPFCVARTAEGSEGGHRLGLFALTACGAGLADDPGRLVERLLPQRIVYEPDPQRHTRYQELFKVYLGLVENLMPNFEQLQAWVANPSG